MLFGLFVSTTPELQGRWIDGATLDNRVFSGFVLSGGGAAHSINLSSPQYTAWKRDGNRLTLWGYSVDNDARIDFIESLQILALTQNKLVLSRADESFEYYRE